MTLQVFEGFDNTSTAADLFSGVLMAASATASSLVAPESNTEYGGRSLSITTVNANNSPSAAYCSIYAAPGSATVVAGASIALRPSVNCGYDIGFTNGVSGQFFCRFILNTVVVYRGDPVNGTITQIASGLTGLPSAGWAYIEIKATIANGSSGSVAIYINGAATLSFTGLNTSADGSATVFGALLGVYDGSGSGFKGYFDDFYMLDNIGSVPYNDVLGPVRVVMRLPTANSSVTFVPSNNTNWLQVSEATIDGDASYNYSSTVNALDLYNANALPETTTEVFAVQVKAAVRKDDAGTITMSTAIKSGGTTLTGAAVALSPAYQYINDIYIADPATSGSWSPTSVNNSTFGYTIVS